MYSQFFILFAMIVVGYYGYRKGWLTREVNKGMGGLVMQATIPAMLVTTIANIQITHDILLGFFLMMAAQAAAMMIFGFLMRLYGKARKLDGRLLDMLDITTGSLNNGFIGLPVATIFFGDVGVMYMSAGVLGLNLYLWSYGVYVLGGKQGGSGAQMGKTFLKGAVNPNCIAIFLGLALTLSNTVHLVPQALLDFLTRLGDLSTPLSLIYIGALAGSSGIKQLFHEKDALEDQYCENACHAISGLGSYADCSGGRYGEIYFSGDSGIAIGGCCAYDGRKVWIWRKNVLGYRTLDHADFRFGTACLRMADTLSVLRKKQQKV